ncbi:hypothetical protein J2754_000732 [Halarchaeum solikamskense]|uniref:helix-turn-helix transcriptional regulator n=1 Tax=Halarchaeum nitratireducens TaxID=489913 RepID=UPI001B3A7F8C|nr:winged helix-turn-helix domain-containing protein [Halarchaeum solikamskense]MBP2250435.1 hypothetical protein [Halarchaeum solikamskense]
MTVVETVRPQPHEFDATWHFGATHRDDYGLGLHYALESVYRDHDWRNDGKPTETITFDGDQWTLAFDYHVGKLDPDSAPPDFDLEQVREFHLYFVAKDDTYDGERADQSQRVRGGTITVRPRWPGLESLPGVEDTSVPDLGGPYVSVRTQASNIAPEKYLDLARLVFSAFDVDQRYLQDPHPISHINDLALYVRPRRSKSGPLYAANGPIARCHQVLVSDRSGYRKHTEDHRERPGDMVLAEVTDERAGDMFRGHRVGFRAKHYYMNDPDAYDPGEFGWHPKFEVSYRTSLTDRTVRWDHPDEYDLDDLYRELDETLFNMIEWAGLSIRAGDHWMSDAYFNADKSVSRSLRLREDPLPEVKDDQTAAVTRLWGEMQESDRAIVDHLLADGGEVSPTEAAEETGYSYRTVRRVVDRLEALIDHTYGSLELTSKHVQQELLQRVQAAEANFRKTVESATMEVADAASGRASGPWKRWRRQYNASVRPGEYDHETIVEIQYQPMDANEEREMLRKLKLAWEETHDDPLRHLTVTYRLGDGTPKEVNDVALAVDKLAPRARRVEEARNADSQRDADDVDWDEWSRMFAQGRVG